MARRRRKINRIKGLRDFDFRPPELEMSSETKRWVLIILLITLGILTFLSLMNKAGTLGVYVDILLKSAFGVTRYYLPLILVIISYFLFRPLKYGFNKVNFLGLIIFVFGFNGLIHLVFHRDDLVAAAKSSLGGGWVGVALAWPFANIMGSLAATIVLLAFSVIGFILLFETCLASILERDEDKEEDDNDESDSEKPSLKEKISNLFLKRRLNKLQTQREKLDDQDQEEDEDPTFSRRDVKVEQSGSTKNESETEEDKKLDLVVHKFKKVKIDLPIDLLDGKTTVPKSGDMKANQMIIKKTLDHFGIRVEIGNAQVGPTVTQYTIKPAEGVKLSRITSLSDNLALALAAHPIRIEAPIPGKSLIGIEVPNQATAIVPLKGLLSSEQFKNRKSNLTINLGKDVMGRPWLADLSKMPHLLVAGATGSGKSVCVNSLIISLLYQNDPGDLKFIMVDPKRVELPIYNGIPHLLTPVITDVKKTVNALRWTIKEMEKRFDILSAAGHRNIESYNANIEETMPYIIFIIDELADLMSSSGAEVEGAIVRLAQMSRAVGIHLALATQRPSVDVLTGLIKANIPARVAFSVASLVDSRTILDASGAEKLLGKGDMLFISADMSKPKRLQGSFTSDKEIEKVVNYLKDEGETEYIEDIVERQQTSANGFSSADSGDEGDPLLDEAKEVIVRAKKASASLLQRRLRVGYARAARILDLLEEQGIIGPGDGAKPRELLISDLNNDTMKDQDEDIEEADEEDNNAVDEICEEDIDEEDEADEENADEEDNRTN